MSSPRKHPSLYPTRLTDLLSGPLIVIKLPSRRFAVNLRFQLYSFRESLRAHPDYNANLLNHANSTTFSVFGKELHIDKPSPTKPQSKETTP